VQANPDPTKSGKKDDPIRVTFGKLMPKDKKDKKGDKAKKAAKNLRRKKRMRSHPNRFFGKQKKVYHHLQH